MSKSLKKITLHDIASRQGVSHTTVSFALRGRSTGMSDQKRQDILSEAVRLNYRPRADKRIDAQKCKVLLLAPEYHSVYGRESYWAKIIAYISKKEEVTGIQLVVKASVNRDIIRSLYKGICEDQVKVVIPVNLGYDELRTVVDLSPVPVISVDVWADAGCNIVGYDYDWIGREAARQFYAMGHRKAAVLTNDLTRDIRTLAFMDQWVLMGGHLKKLNFSRAITLEGIYRGLRDMLRRKIGFTALFCLNDPCAMAAMQAMYECDLRVPDDISLIGCDDHSCAATSHPSLSTFRLDEVLHAEQLIERIASVTKSPDDVRVISNKAVFVSRESTRNL